MVENLLISLKKSTEDAIKTASKKAIQKTAEATGDLIGNEIADKITSDVERTTYKKRFISPEERQQFIDKLRLVRTMQQTNHLNLEQEIGF